MTGHFTPARGAGRLIGYRRAPLGSARPVPPRSRDRQATGGWNDVRATPFGWIRAGGHRPPARTPAGPRPGLGARFVVHARLPLRLAPRRPLRRGAGPGSAAPGPIPPVRPGLPADLWRPTRHGVRRPHGLRPRRRRLPPRARGAPTAVPGRVLPGLPASRRGRFASGGAVPAATCALSASARALCTSAPPPRARSPPGAPAPAAPSALSASPRALCPPAPPAGRRVAGPADGGARDAARPGRLVPRLHPRPPDRRPDPPGRPDPRRRP